MKIKTDHPIAYTIGSLIGYTLALVFMSTMMTLVGMYTLALVGIL